MNKPLELTDKQKNILKFIIKFKEDKGFSPTLREMAIKFNVDRRTIYDQIKKIESKGFIKKTNFLARAIQVLKPAGCYPKISTIAKFKKKHGCW